MWNATDGNNIEVEIFQGDGNKRLYSDRNINKEMIKLVGKITGSRKLESLSKEEKEETVCHLGMRRLNDGL